MAAGAPHHIAQCRAIPEHTMHQAPRLRNGCRSLAAKVHALNSYGQLLSRVYEQKSILKRRRSNV